LAKKKAHGRSLSPSAEGLQLWEKKREFKRVSGCEESGEEGK